MKDEGVKVSVEITWQKRRLCAIQFLEVIFVTVVFSAIIWIFPMKAIAEQSHLQNGNRMYGFSAYTGEQSSCAGDLLPISGTREWNSILDWSQQTQIESD